MRLKPSTLVVLPLLASKLLKSLYLWWSPQYASALSRGEEGGGTVCIVGAAFAFIYAVVVVALIVGVVSLVMGRSFQFPLAKLQVDRRSLETARAHLLLPRVKSPGSEDIQSRTTQEMENLCLILCLCGLDMSEVLRFSGPRAI